MPTVFIALQCYHCSTMQVKQQKKSSNKWTCVVCNQRQSITRIYARAFMAKDVRSFVQTFNMSRFALDHQIATNPIQDQPQYDGTQTLELRPNKRTDWTEFIHPESDTLLENDDDKGNAFEPNVVTELPKEMFTKPKFKNALKGSCNDDNGYRPVLQKRNNSRKRCCDSEHMEMEPNKCQQMMRQGSDELTYYTTVPVVESAKFQQSMGPSRRKVYETRGRDYDYERYEVTRQQKMTAEVSFRCNGNRVEDCRSSGSGDFPEKQYAKSQFAAIALRWKGNGGQHEKGSESLATTRDQKKKTSTVSKWDVYITEDDDGAGGYSGNMHGGSCRDVFDPTSNWKSDMYDMNSGDQKVEEDVHPDFL